MTHESKLPLTEQLLIDRLTDAHSYLRSAMDELSKACDLATVGMDEAQAQGLHAICLGASEVLEGMIEGFIV